MTNGKEFHQYNKRKTTTPPETTWTQKNNTTYGIESSGHMLA